MIFEGNRYSRKGFLFKSFAMSAVVSVGAATLAPAAADVAPPPGRSPMA